MSKELEILKKHLGEVEGKGEFATKELCAQLDGANDFIAILQVLNNTLKKLKSNLKALNSASNDEKANLHAQNALIIENASFMGENLFGTKFSTNLSGANFEFKAENPFLVLENGGYEGVLAYVEDKQDEISALLDKLGDAIALGDFYAPQMSGNLGDLKELLR